ncbi:unnamed protein product [Mesocestoides corti]|uniref:Uncharacterized protein n=1 Tax=Mesocestoides corti TaxID=53468 RepID=A0A158QTL2_MESCO|nr:unnamed protein product [Mesocestoides corti]
MSTVIIGALYGLRESFYAPKGLWLLHFKTSGLSSSSHFVCRRSSATDPLLQPLHGQALRRLRLSAAMGEKRFSTGGAKSQSTESLNRLSSERPLYSADNILGLLGRIWVINVLLLFASGYVTFLALIRQWLWNFFIVRCICGLVTLLLQNFIFLVMELINAIYLKKICEKITSMRQLRSSSACKSGDVGNKHPRDTSLSRTLNCSSPSSVSCFNSSQHSYGVGKQLIDWVYSIVFFIVYRLQWKLCASFVPFFLVNFLINSVSLAFMYASYAFEYHARQTSDVTFEVILSHIVSYWPVFIGYGSTLGILVSLLPGPFGWSDLLIAFWYPVMVVGAFQVSWSRALDPTRHRVSPRLRSLAVLSMRPALFVTNALISLFASLLGYSCTAAHRSCHHRHHR